MEYRVLFTQAVIEHVEGIVNANTYAEAVEMIECGEVTVLDSTQLDVTITNVNATPVIGLPIQRSNKQ